MAKILIVADSAFELLMSIQIKLSLYKDVYTTIIITDRSQNAYDVYARLSRLNVFEEVLYVEANNFLYLDCLTKYKKIPLLSRLANKIYDYAHTLKARKVLNLPDSYTLFISSELDFFSRYMYLAVKKNAVPYILGEGLFAFAGLKENIASNSKANNASFVRKLDAILYYGEKLGELPLPKQINIPSVNNNREEILSILNCIYDYTPHRKIYKDKIIFFEESYSNDGGDDNAISFLSGLIEKYGTDKILVKRHPRDKENRFEILNVNNIEPFYIPWELIMLNGDCKGCALLAANSGSVILSKLYDFCNEKNEYIMLNRLMQFKYVGGHCMDVYFRFLDDLYKKESFLTPCDKEELFEFIDDALENGKS